MNTDRKSQQNNDQAWKQSVPPRGSARASSPTVKEGSPRAPNSRPGALLDSRATAPCATRGGIDRVQAMLSLIAVLLFVFFVSQFSLAIAQQPARDVSKETARPTRDWVRDGVIYEIYPRDFSYQDNFKGVTAKLDDLKQLGVTILWLMPIHPIGQEKKKGTVGSPYAVRDYYAINPDYGTKEDLKQLISEAHRRGLKVIIDIVANHTSWDSVLMKHPEFYKRDAKGNITYPHDWYDIAALNYTNQPLRVYMTDMLKYWLREFNLDGFRCDVAGEVPTDFWENARVELEKINPDIVMLAEAHKPELLVKAFDLDYSWPLHSALTDVLQGRMPASQLRLVWEQEIRESPRNAIHMRFSDNHDERRALARFGEPASLAASALVFTLDGVPMLYNGMEVGDTTESGAPALFEKLPIFWLISERRPEFARFYQEMLALRRSSEALRRGSLEWVRNSDEARVIAYVRQTATEELLVAINLSSRPYFGNLEIGNGATYLDVTPDISAPLPPDAPGPDKRVNKRTVGLPALQLDAWGYRFFRRVTK